MNIYPDSFEPTLLKKREEIIQKGINPYPYSYRCKSYIVDIVENASRIFQNLDKVCTVGRITAQRFQGKVIFLDMQDNTGRIQVYLKKGIIDEELWGEIILLLDIGDLVLVEGDLFKTHSGELTIKATRLDVMAKCVVRIPMGKVSEGKSFYQPKDPDIKFREKYIDWITDKESRTKIVKRSKIISVIRQYMEAGGFLEVQTPTIEMIYGGAEARPFETNIWALGNQSAYLRISPELYLKRYIVGGFDKVFSICQNFRNEGIDKNHNPEFTMMEWYEAGTDYFDQMKRFEDLVSHVVFSLFGQMKVDYQGTILDFSPPWDRKKMVDSINDKLQIDVLNISKSKLQEVCRSLKIDISAELSQGELIMVLFENLCEEELIQPTFIMDFPVEVSPLTKSKRGCPGFVERFEPYVMKMEIGNAYSELTDPVEQFERLNYQRSLKSSTDYQNHPLDLDFVKSIGCGMPPTGGAGIGLDRLIMLLTDAGSIKEVIPFPMMKPRA